MSSRSVVPASPSRLIWPALFAVAIAWAYWPTLAVMARRWTHDAQYSHGYLVPVFAAVLLGLRRDRLDSAAPDAFRPILTWGLAFVLIAVNLRLAAAMFYNDWLDGISLLPLLAGLALVAGGWAALRWCWPAVAFLAFMVPLPFAVEVALAHPLQRIATVCSAYALQTLGFAVVAEGNVLHLGDIKVGVAEACSGLSMLLIFFALAFALVLVLPNRPAWQRIALVIAAVPIAVASNVLRVTLTGVLYQTVSGGVATLFYHDLAGWIMMPVALAMFAGLLAFFDRLLLPDGQDEPLPVLTGTLPVPLPTERPKLTVPQPVLPQATE